MAEAGELRYGFGKNWAEYVEKNLSEPLIAKAQAHLADFLRLDSLNGHCFLDIGCGSGLHSLAAYRLGADRVVSFDYDADSVATTEAVRRHAGEPANWSVIQGSVLDRHLMEGLPKADIVYSWGVLHHTGDMWGAVRNAVIPLKPDGVCYLALYSSDVHIDPPPQYWLKTKRAYNESGPIGRRVMEWSYVLRFHMIPALKAGQNFFDVVRKYGDARRGMNFWTDVKDWLGGYPMDFASLKETRTFAQRELGLDLVNLRTGEACTEYLLARSSDNRRWRSILADRKLVPLPGPYVPQGGSCYTSAVPGLKDQADSGESPQRSRVMIYEDGELLGLAHSLHSDIINHGKGRFSHWGEQIYFSTSDNSDPNMNGKVYSYCEVF